MFRLIRRLLAGGAIALAALSASPAVTPPVQAAAAVKSDSAVVPVGTVAAPAPALFNFTTCCTMPPACTELGCDYEVIKQVSDDVLNLYGYLIAIIANGTILYCLYTDGVGCVFLMW